MPSSTGCPDSTPHNHVPPMIRRRFRATALAIAAVLASGPLAAQQGSGTFAGHEYQPGVDVLDYDITLDLPDTGAMIRGDVIVTARRAAGVNALRLDLVRSLAVRQVLLDGRDVRAERAGDAVIVPLAGAASDSVQVRVRYDGVVHDGLIVRKDASGRWTWFGDNWPDRARQWLPTVDHPSDKATVTWTVRAPNGRIVVANGSLLSTRQLTGRNAGRTETRWRESHPVPTYVMVIGAGPLSQVAIPGGTCRHRQRTVVSRSRCTSCPRTATGCRARLPRRRKSSRCSSGWSGHFRTRSSRTSSRRRASAEWRTRAPSSTPATSFPATA